MRRHVLGPAPALLMALVLGCSDPTALVVVQVRSDYAPGDEIFEVRTIYFNAERTRRLSEQRRIIDRETDLASGFPVGELTVPLGSYVVRVDAFGPDGAQVARAQVSAAVEGSMVVTVVLSRACRDVSCPGPGDPADATECVAGQCVTPDCVAGEGECVMECSSDLQCVPTASCAMGSCSDGICLLLPREGACPAGERCDPDVGCVEETMLPDAGPTDMDAGTPPACADGDTCDDGLFCNGADSCMGGTCSVHAGNPCSTSCDESSDRCAECSSSADCPSEELGPWSSCGGFGGTCDESGKRTRTVTTWTCEGGTCRSSTSERSGTCSRDQGGVSCGADDVTAWGTCTGSGMCPTSGNEVRTRTVYRCSGGSCQGSPMMESRSCTLDPTGDPCDDGDPCTDPDRCTSTGACVGVPECRGSACSGSCPIPVCTGACLDYCDCI